MSNLPDPVSFTFALEKFSIHLKGQKRSTSTSIAYQGDLNQLRLYLEDRRITQATSIQTTHLEEYISHLGTQGYTPKSISRKINSFKTFFKYLHEQAYSHHNPAHPLTHPKYETKPPHILTQIEFKNLRDACRLDIRISSIIELLLQTGIRIGELANLHLEDAKKTEVYIRPQENNLARTVPLNHSAASALQNYLSIRPPVPDPHLFVTKTGRPLLIRNIRTAIDRYFTKAGVKNARVNDLRHTFIAFQLESGVDLDFLNKTIGHRRKSSTEKYLDHIKIPREVPHLTRLVEL